MIKVSIIVPCYNQDKYIAQTLKSVMKQSYSDWECIVVNDGSTDNSEKVVKQYAAKDSRIKYIAIKNSGVAIARNTAVEASSGEFILPLDSDDIISNDYVELAVRAFEQIPDLTLVYCKARIFGKENRDWELKDFTYNQLLLCNMIFCSAMYRKSDFLKTGGYDTTMDKGLEDWELWINLLTPESKVYRIPKICFYYRIKEKSRSSQVETGSTNCQLMIDRIFLKHCHKYMGWSNPIQVYNRSNTYTYSKEFQIGVKVLKPFRAIKNYYLKKIQVFYCK